VHEGDSNPGVPQERLRPEVSVTFATDPVKNPLHPGVRDWDNRAFLDELRPITPAEHEGWGNILATAIGRLTVEEAAACATQQCYCFVCVGSVVDLLTDEVKRRPEAEPIFSRSFWLLQHVMGCANCHRASFLKKIV